MRRALIRSGLIPLVAFAPGWAVAQQPLDRGWYWHHHNMMWDGGWLMYVLGPIFMLLPLAALVAVVIFAARWAGGPQSRMHPPERTALDILKERFARGEIDKAEYEDRRRVLSE